MNTVLKLTGDIRRNNQHPCLALASLFDFSRQEKVFTSFT